MTLTEVRELLAELDLRPSKVLGQNFLIDSNILQISIRQADVREDEVVLEIGPGLGALTSELVSRAAHVFAIEKDSRLASYVRTHFPDLTLIEGDATKVPLPRCDKVVANLPYSVSTPVLERLVESAEKPRRIVVMLQREVAHRLVATPRHKDYGALTLFTQLHYHVTMAHVVSQRCFYPAPSVESAIVVLDLRATRTALLPGAPFHAIVRAGFNHRRKMLRKLIADFGDSTAAFHTVGIGETIRAEELSLEQWISLANCFAPNLQQKKL
jgi:16S rRNA (adenine1518-N6/adenine1519-N6)-dimethyltransferase